MSEWLSLGVAAAIGYLLGSIPFGYIVCRLVAGVDIRTLGSGRTGGTNARRVLGWKGFTAVALLDAGKGAVAVLLAGALLDGPDPWLKAVAGIAAVVGHSWSLYLSFGGGRGVAPGVGALVCMMPEALLLALIIGVPLIVRFRYMSLGSIAGTAVAPVAALVLVLLLGRPWAYFYFALMAAALVVAKHHDNIRRLLTGTERQL